MTKKKPPSASFPHWLQGVGSKASTEINLSKADRKRLREKSASGMAPEEALRELLAEKHAAKLASMKPEVAHQYLQDLGRQPSYAKHPQNLKHYDRWFRVHQLRKMSPDRSLDSIFEAVANDVLPVVDPETTSQFSFGDDP